MAEDSSRGTAEMTGDFCKCAIERAAAGLDQLFGCAAHALHFGGIFQEVDHFDARVFRAFDLNGGARFDKARGHGGKVFHRWAEDWDFAESGGFEDVVSAGADKGAADKNAVGQTVEGSKFADRVEEEDAGVVRYGLLVAVGGRVGAWAGHGEFSAANEV